MFRLCRLIESKLGNGDRSGGLHKWVKILD